MFKLIYNKNCYTATDIITEKFKISPLSETATAAFSFCKEWLERNTHFSMNTSGSTGKPKKITVKRSQVEASAKNTIQFLRLTVEDRALVCLNPTYVGGKMMLARAMLLEMETHLVEPVANPLKEINPKSLPTFFAFVPLQLNAIFQEGTLEQLAQAKAILVGGAPINTALEKSLKQKSFPIYQTYGMTETVSHIALKKVNADNHYNLLPNNRIDTDENSCLRIKGEVTDNQWINTNDRVRLISSNKFEWLGRIDFIANTGGVKIQLEEVEKVIAETLLETGVSDAIFLIAKLPDVRLGEKIVMLVEKLQLNTSQLEEIKNNLTSRIHKYAVPKAIKVVEKIPRTTSQKFDRIAAARLFQQQ